MCWREKLWEFQKFQLYIYIYIYIYIKYIDYTNLLQGLIIQASDTKQFLNKETFEYLFVSINIGYHLSVIQRLWRNYMIQHIGWSEMQAILALSYLHKLLLKRLSLLILIVDKLPDVQCEKFEELEGIISKIFSLAIILSILIISPSFLRKTLTILKVLLIKYTVWQ